MYGMTHISSEHRSKQEVICDGGNDRDENED